MRKINRMKKGVQQESKLNHAVSYNAYSPLTSYDVSIEMLDALLLRSSLNLDGSVMDKRDSDFQLYSI